MIKAVWACLFGALIAVSSQHCSGVTQLHYENPTPAKAVDGECTDIEPPKLTHRVDPIYPSEARQQRLQGEVVLQAIVDKDGSVADLHVARSSSETLSKYAVDAVSQWHYKPAYCRSDPATPIRVYLSVSLTFKV